MAKAAAEKVGGLLPRMRSLFWTRESLAALAVLTAAATVLRFLFLVRKPFWFDECFSVEVARLRWSDFFKLMWRREANMSLYYLLLRGWLHLGSSQFLVRSLSVIFSLAALPAIYWLAAQLFDRRVGLLSAALLCFNAYHIRYAQEARSYSLFVLLAILSSGFFAATLQKNSRCNRAGYVITSVLAVYAHLYALLLIGAQWLSTLAWRTTDDESWRRTPRRVWIWIAVASAPIVIFAAKTGAGPIRWILRPTFHDVLEFGEHLSGNDGLVLLLIYLAACLAAFITPRWRERADESTPSGNWSLRFLLIWLLFPILMVLLL
jgi:mannosyltransferase